VGYAFYMSAALLFSINGTVSKLLMEHLDATRLSQLRSSAAFVVLLIAVLITRPHALKLHGWGEFRLIALYGILGVTMTQWLYFIGIHLLPVGVALILEFTAPLMVAVWVKFAWSHHIQRMVWLGLFIALSGLVLITEVWNGFRLDVLGVTASLGAAAALAIYYLAGERLLTGTYQRDSLSLTMWGFGMAAVFWAVFQPWWTFPFESLSGTGQIVTSAFDLDAPLWGMATWMVVMGTVLPFWLSLLAMKHISAQQASAIGMTEPVLASVVAWLVMGETLSLWQVVGGLVTLTGIGVAEAARSR
jgi:drug/metabolite transporter (DMT)-like permease